MLRLSIVPAVLAAGALALPGVASAGTLTASGACFEQAQSIELSGAGYSPYLNLTITGVRGEASAYANADGTFTGEAALPDYNSYTPRAVTLSTVDQDPSHNASLTLQEVKFGTNLPVGGKPGAVVSWQFAGFPTGAKIYVHFRYAHNGPFKTVKDVLFGTASGPCGVLSKKAKRVPVKNPKHGGDWYVQVDTKPKYSSHTTSNYYYKTFSIR